MSPELIEAVHTIIEKNGDVHLDYVRDGIKKYLREKYDEEVLVRMDEEKVTVWTMLDGFTYITIKGE